MRAVQEKPTAVAEKPSMVQMPGVLVADESAYRSQTKTMVVYNPMSLEAIIAAGEIKRQRSAFTVVSVDQTIPDTEPADVYIWIGVTPDLELKRRLKASKAVHQVYSAHDAMPVDETGYKPTLIERACVDLGIRYGERLSKTAYMASRFYDADMQERELAGVFTDLQRYLKVLTGGDALAVISGDPIQAYRQEVALIKSRLTNGCRMMKVMDGQTQTDVLYTHFSDHHYVVAQRLIRRAHAHWMNHSVGVNGALVYTNLRNPVFNRETKDITILLN